MTAFENKILFNYGLVAEEDVILFTYTLTHLLSLVYLALFRKINLWYSYGCCNKIMFISENYI